MRKLIPGNILILLSGLILLSFSCSPESCLEETDSFLKVSFYDFVTNKLRAPDSLTVYGLNMETNKVYNKALRVQPALLPLNSATSECTFIIRINGISDTIRFMYNSYPHLVSKECGITFYHQLDTSLFHTFHAIRHIYINNRTITTLNEENIRLSF
jgi:hypothetical protein